MKKTKVDESTDYLKSRLPFVPEIGLVLGSGLGPMAEELEVAVCIPYGEIPHFRVSTAPDHTGRLICGMLEGKKVLCMQGRLHGYEGNTAQEVAYPVWLMHELGVDTLFATNAAGAEGSMR